MRAQSNSLWCLKGSPVRLTNGLPAPRTLDLITSRPSAVYTYLARIFILRGEASIHGG